MRWLFALGAIVTTVCFGCANGSVGTVSGIAEDAGVNATSGANPLGTANRSDDGRCCELGRGWSPPSMAWPAATVAGGQPLPGEQRRRMSRRLLRRDRQADELRRRDLVHERLVRREHEPVRPYPERRGVPSRRVLRPEGELRREPAVHAGRFRLRSARSQRVRGALVV